MSWDKERIAQLRLPIRRTMIRTLGCFWKGTAYMAGEGFTALFPDGWHEITLEVAWEPTGPACWYISTPGLRVCVRWPVREGMKTIRQIADEIGVSKQAVYKRYKGKLYTVCAPYAHTEQGVLYLSEQAETLIKQDFLRDGCPNGSHTDTHTERSIGAVPEQSQEAEW